MKHVTSSFAILVATFVIGCQDTTNLDPIAATALESPLVSKTQPVNTIALNAVLHEPGIFHNSFIEVAGTVAYQAMVVPLDPIPPNPQYAVRLNLTTDALLRPDNSNSPVWSVSGSSEDLTGIPENGTAYLAKRYPLEGRTDGMTLNLRLRITLTNVELNNMWLELPRMQREENLD